MEKCSRAGSNGDKRSFPREGWFGNRRDTLMSRRVTKEALTHNLTAGEVDRSPITSHQSNRLAVAHGLPERLSTDESRVTNCESRLLIGSPVIRICSNPRKISHLNFSNRHKTGGFCVAAYPATNLGRRAAFGSHDSGITTYESRLLIGPPVIRILRKLLKTKERYPV